jgi:SAM-dependent methyltransferase
MVMADLDSPMLEPDTAGGEAFDREYYEAHCGDLPYDHWVDFFGKVADELIRSFRPTRVFDAGCASGFLVQAFWDRGVEAYGRDISRFANSKVRQDLKPYCAVGSIAGPIEGKYDLVTCIEVLEHMPETEALEAIESISKVTDRILFSSSPADFDEPTHINIQPTLYWLRHFAAQGFAPDIGYAATFLTPQALVFERTETAPSDKALAACAELVRMRLLAAERERANQTLEAEGARLRHEVEAERARANQMLRAGEDRLRSERARFEQERSQIEDEMEAERARVNHNEAELIKALCELEAERRQTVSQLVPPPLTSRSPGPPPWWHSLGKRVERSTRLAIRRSLKFIRGGAIST